MTLFDFGEGLHKEESYHNISKLVELLSMYIIISVDLLSFQACGNVYKDFEFFTVLVFVFVFRNHQVFTLVGRGARCDRCG